CRRHCVADDPKRPHGEPHLRGGKPGAPAGRYSFARPTISIESRRRWPQHHRRVVTQLEVEMARQSILVLSCAVSVSIALAIPAALTAQRPAAKAAVLKKPAPRTAWGDPDLTGIWTGSTITPLERPDQFAGREFLTEDEAATLEKRPVAARAD